MLITRILLKDLFRSLKGSVIRLSLIVKIVYDWDELLNQILENKRIFKLITILWKHLSLLVKV